MPDKHPLIAIRNGLLEAKTSSVAIPPSEALPNVWGCMMETGYPQGAATVFYVADGSASLYFPGSGGVIGAGGQPPVRAAGQALLKISEHVLASLDPTQDFSFPQLGHVRFYVLTHSGPRSAQGHAEALGNGTGPLSVLFFAVHALISQIRLAAPPAK